MSGIEHRTRLQQLYALRDRLNLEIRVEEAKELGGHVRNSEQRIFRDSSEAPSSHPDPQNATPMEIRAWALAEGLITEIKRGALPGHLRDAYYAAHTSPANESGVTW